MPRQCSVREFFFVLTFEIFHEFCKQVTDVWLFHLVRFPTLFSPSFSRTKSLQSGSLLLQSPKRLFPLTTISFSFSSMVLSLSIIEFSLSSEAQSWSSVAISLSSTAFSLCSNCRSVSMIPFPLSILCPLFVHHLVSQRGKTMNQEWKLSKSFITPQSKMMKPFFTLYFFFMFSHFLEAWMWVILWCKPICLRMALEIYSPFLAHDNRAN